MVDAALRGGLHGKFSNDHSGFILPAPASSATML